MNADAETPKGAEEPPVIDARAGDPGLVSALAEAMAEASAVEKSSRNAQQNYSYASGDDILAAVRAPLLQRGILLTQEPQIFAVNEITSSTGARGTSVIVAQNFTFRHGPSGQEFTIAGWRGEGHDYPGDKAYSKAYTNAIKTFVKAQWLLPTEDTGNAPDRAPREADLPQWAAPASGARKREMRDALAPIVGEHNATLIGTKIRDSIGSVPDVVVLAAQLVAAAVAAIRGDGAPVEPAEPDASLAADPATPADAAQGQPPAEEPDPGEDTAPAGPAAGSVPLPKLTGQVLADVHALRAAGCICHSPIEASSDEPPLGAASTACPIQGHGIAF